MSADRFFYALKSHWTPLPPGIQDSFLIQVKEFVELERRLRTDPDLAEYDAQIYPELVTLLQLSPPLQSDDPRAVLHLCTEQLQVMENVFLALKLAEYHAYPLNRGWMSLFRRWTSAERMRLLWPSLRSMYSRDFVAFAEYQLNLSDSRIEATAVDDRGELQRIRRAFSHLIEVVPEPGAPQVHQRPRINDRLTRWFDELEQEWPPTSKSEDYAAYFAPFLRTTGAWVIAHPSAAQEVWGVGLLAELPQRSQLLAGVTLQRLMVWIRPAYRGVRLGTNLLDEILKVDREEEKTRQQVHDEREAKQLGLMVLLPPLRRSRPGYAEEMAGWLRFYESKGFVKTTPKDAQTILRWNRTRHPVDPAAFFLVTPKLLKRLRENPPP